ncbi:hypothetical protein CYMTET_50053 [Cymbomonas tetramitiformis]|uniref:Uncharacterized protein n=1 Tax=Cymbomonas tetramitiformis TaxID=36881 RepID=A0AAE0BNV3_9CHLO|nr:hypothetical protein CYMTET_50053 [Cymbomonas tetramitiformis]
MPMKAKDVANYLLKHPMTAELVEDIKYTHDRIHPISNNHQKVLFLKMKKGEDGEPLQKGGDYLVDEKEPPEIMDFPTEMQVLVQGQERGRLVLSYFQGFEYCSSVTHGEDRIVRLNHIKCMCYNERMLQGGEAGLAPEQKGKGEKRDRSTPGSVGETKKKLNKSFNTVSG